MNIELEHTGLSVSSLERSISFYRDMLGFQLSRIIECPPDIRLGEVVGLPGCDARIAIMTLGDKTIELFEYFDPRGRPIPQERTQSDIGFSHLGFVSADIHADYDRLKSGGVAFYNEPLEYRPGVWVAYFYGPDGETCEIFCRKQ